MLRLVASQEPPNSHLSQARPSRSGNGAEKHATILVVEDEILTRAASADYLRSCGYRVLEATSAEEAQAIFQSGEPIRILFTDIQLPGGVDGFALASWVEKDYPHVRIIMASGAPDVMKQAEVFSLKRPFLNKPYAFEVLLFHVRRLIAT
jgi:DNA-binding response OmpR family regulator